MLKKGSCTIMLKTIVRILVLWVKVEITIKTQ